MTGQEARRLIMEGSDPPQPTDLRQETIEGDLDLAGVTRSSLNLEDVTLRRGSLSLSRGTFTGHVNLRGLRIEHGGLGMVGTKVAGFVNLWGVHIRGGVDLMGAEIGDYLDLQMAEFGSHPAGDKGGLCLEGASLEGVLILTGLVAEGELRLNTRSGPKAIYIERERAEAVHRANPTVPIISEGALTLVPSLA